MKTKEQRLIYMTAVSACILMYCFSYYLYQSELGKPGSSCFFVLQFNMACPACGGSHAIRSLLHGEWSDAFKYNALATLMFCCGVFVSTILMYDAVRACNYFIQLYYFTYNQLKKRSVRYTIAFALIVFWLINIYTYRS